MACVYIKSDKQCPTIQLTASHQPKIWKQVRAINEQPGSSFLFHGAVGGSDGKVSARNAGDPGLIPGSGSFPWGPLKCTQQIFIRRICFHGRETMEVSLCKLPCIDTILNKPEVYISVKSIQTWSSYIFREAPINQRVFTYWVFSNAQNFASPIPFGRKKDNTGKTYRREWNASMLCMWAFDVGNWRSKKGEAYWLEESVEPPWGGVSRLVKCGGCYASWQEAFPRRRESKESKT